MKSKLCYTCGKRRELDQFYVLKSGKDAGKVMSKCKSCASEYARKYREDPEVRRRLAENTRRWQQENRERYIAYQKAYRRKHAGR